LPHTRFKRKRKAEEIKRERNLWSRDGGAVGGRKRDIRRGMRKVTFLLSPEPHNGWGENQKPVLPPAACYKSRFESSLRKAYSSQKI